MNLIEQALNILNESTLPFVGKYELLVSLAMDANGSKILEPGTIVYVYKNDTFNSTKRLRYVYKSEADAEDPDKLWATVGMKFVNKKNMKKVK